MSERKAITLSLVGWQKRMIQDHMTGMRISVPIEEISKVTIPIIDRRQWIKYMLPTRGEALKGAWNLYLTDAQINKVASALGGDVRITALRISPDMVKSGAVVFG